MVPAINECTSYSPHMLWPSETALREANEKPPTEADLYRRLALGYSLETDP